MVSYGGVRIQVQSVDSDILAANQGRPGMTEAELRGHLFGERLDTIAKINDTDIPRCSRLFLNNIGGSGQRNEGLTLSVGPAASFMGTVRSDPQYASHNGRTSVDLYGFDGKAMVPESTRVVIDGYKQVSGELGSQGSIYAETVDLKMTRPLRIHLIKQGNCKVELDGYKSLGNQGWPEHHEVFVPTGISRSPVKELEISLVSGGSLRIKHDR